MGVTGECTMKKQDSLSFFKNEAPEVARAFDGLIQSLVQSKGLDEKTKHLLYIALKAASGDDTAIPFHVPMAKKLGATRDEIKDAILLTLTVSGLKGVVTCLPKALAAYDEGSPLKL